MRLIMTSGWMPWILSAAMVLGTATVGHSDEPTITVGGNAEIRVAPDQVVITAAVDSRAKSVGDAMKANDQAIRGVLDFLEESGIEAKHVHTEHISIQPIMPPTHYASKLQQTANQSAEPFAEEEEFHQQPIGYAATRQLAITIVHLEDFESIYRGLIELGINRVQGIEFRVTELRKLRDEARLQAVRAAKEKAQALSAELGASLASVKTIRETGNEYGYRGRMAQNTISDAFGDDSDTGGFAAGQIAITAAVEVVFVLGDTALEN